MVIDDIAQHIHNKSIAVLGLSLFKTYMPDDPDSCMAIIDTGGLEPSKEIVDIEQPTFQIFIRNTNYSTGKALVDRLRDEFHGKSQIRLIPNGSFFFFIFLMSEGTSLGRDEKKRSLFSINFRCMIR